MTISGGAYNGYLFTGALAESPVPEPASMTLFGIGAVALVSYHWKRRKRIA